MHYSQENHIRIVVMPVPPRLRGREIKIELQDGVFLNTPFDATIVLVSFELSDVRATHNSVLG